jgi:hypothetical protein
MDDQEFLALMQGFAARRAVGAYAIRSSEKGTVKACRDFLRCKVDLSRFGTSSPAAFGASLNRTTRQLAIKLGSQETRKSPPCEGGLDESRIVSVSSSASSALSSSTCPSTFASSLPASTPVGNF